MHDGLKAAAGELTEQLGKKMEEVANLKKTINMLYRQMGQQEPYEDEATETVKGAGLKLKPDQFYGMSPVVAAKAYLTLRNEPCTAEEILAGLERGGFDFTAQNWKDKDRLRNLAIGLGKNSYMFQRLPSGPFGLLDWYPEQKKRKEQERADATKEGKEPELLADSASEKVD